MTRNPSGLVNYQTGFLLTITPCINRVRSAFAEDDPDLGWLVFTEGERNRP